jgi:hypothetical protein
LLRRQGGCEPTQDDERKSAEGGGQVWFLPVRLIVASAVRLCALALRSVDLMYSESAENASAPVSSLFQIRFSADVSVRVVTKCHRAASGAANMSGADTAKSAVFGVSKPRVRVSRRPTRPSRLRAPETLAAQRGTAGEAELMSLCLGCVTTTPSS